jgi:hypothetical protein
LAGGYANAYKDGSFSSFFQYNFVCHATKTYTIWYLHQMEISCHLPFSHFNYVSDSFRMDKMVIICSSTIATTINYIYWEKE